MKKIEVIIKPFHIEDLREALLEQDFAAMTVSEIRRFPSTHATPVDDFLLEPDLPMGVSDFDPRLKVEIVVSDSRLHLALRIVARHSQTQCPVLVQSISDVVRIRTNEHGEVAV